MNTIQSELLIAKHQNTKDSISKILTKIEELCRNEMDMTLFEILDLNEYCQQQLYKLKNQK